MSIIRIFNDNSVDQSTIIASEISPRDAYLLAREHLANLQKETDTPVDLIYAPHSDVVKINAPLPSKEQYNYITFKFPSLVTPIERKAYKRRLYDFIYKIAYNWDLQDYDHWRVMLLVLEDTNIINKKEYGRFSAFTEMIVTYCICPGFDSRSFTNSISRNFPIDKDHIKPGYNKLYNDIRDGINKILKS